ncbi:hypothetical protein [Phytoactinopolyspora endophytica]|uniref:hypothetical protein n=1 Tax=Phytoactinopolyspora endophytica TaxID=1642495 RepID=UPI00101D183E|nr:hypothetical protein [Phytoactinopolyspora endophytica]
MSWERENADGSWESQPRRRVSTGAKVRLWVLVVVGIVAGEALGLAIAEQDDRPGWLRPILIGGSVAAAVLIEFGVFRRLNRR